MKKYCFALLAFCFFAPSAYLFSQTDESNFVPGEIYLKIRDELPMDFDTNSSFVDVSRQLPFLLSSMAAFEVTAVKSTFYFSKTEALRRTFRISFEKRADTEAFLKQLNAQSAVEYAERVPAGKINHTPNDLGANTNAEQWNLHIVQAQRAWDIWHNGGGAGPVVAIVDNAVQSDHPDLAAVMVAGRDVANNDNTTNPPNANGLWWHGTHCAGLAGAVSDNGIGVASIGHGIFLMPIKACLSSNANGDDISFGYEGITWAADHGAKIISCSWGNYTFSQTAQNVVNAAWNQGAIVLGSAGNDNTNALHYPSAYNNCIAVANTTITDAKAGDSNYGTWIDIAAPGTFVNSTTSFNTYNSAAGTSMSCPMVAGLLGLAWGMQLHINGSANRTTLLNCLYNSADNIDTQNPNFVGQLGAGRINAYRMLKCLVFCNAFSTHSGTTVPGPIDYHQATLLVDTNGGVAAGAQMTFNSGGYIDLLPGAFMEYGSRFDAYIDGCP